MTITWPIYTFIATVLGSLILGPVGVIGGLPTKLVAKLINI